MSASLRQPRLSGVSGDIASINSRLYNLHTGTLLQPLFVTILFRSDIDFVFQFFYCCFLLGFVSYLFPAGSLRNVFVGTSHRFTLIGGSQLFAYNPQLETQAAQAFVRPVH